MDGLLTQPGHAGQYLVALAVTVNLDIIMIDAIRGQQAEYRVGADLTRFDKLGQH